MIKTTSVVKGIASFLLPAARNSHTPGGTIAAEHCYSAFFRHYRHLEAAGVAGVPAVVAELGPGNSLGMGFCALLAGARRYHALDVMDHTDPDTDLAIFDRLVAMLRRREEIPHRPPYDTTFPFLDRHELPASVVATLDENLRDERVRAIREDVIHRTGAFISFAVPWRDRTDIAAGSVDWICSHAVLAHVDELEATYRRLSGWLAPGGVMTHMIDFSSHRLTEAWNGHWAVGDTAWALARGNRHFLLNRRWCAVHRAHLEGTGMELVEERRWLRDDGLPRDRFKPPFHTMDDQDARTYLAFLVARSRMALWALALPAWEMMQPLGGMTAA